MSREEDSVDYAKLAYLKATKILEMAQDSNYFLSPSEESEIQNKECRCCRKTKEFGELDTNLSYEELGEFDTNLQYEEFEL